MHDETPDISIVVPVYNTERFLPACLESIDIQGTGSFEVILVDDGSTDGSPEICDAYCNKRERAFVILQGQRRPSRCTTRRSSRGKWALYSFARLR